MLKHIALHRQHGEVARECYLKMFLLTWTLSSTDEKQCLVLQLCSHCIKGSRKLLWLKWNCSQQLHTATRWPWDTKIADIQLHLHWKWQNHLGENLRMRHNLVLPMYGFVCRYLNALLLHHGTQSWTLGFSALSVQEHWLSGELIGSRQKLMSQHCTWNKLWRTKMYSQSRKSTISKSYQ